MHRSPFHILLLVAAAALLAACNPTKRVPQGEYLLVENIVKSDAKGVSNDELRSILKQKPNNKVLGQRLYLHFYNLSDPEKTAMKKAASDSLCAIRYEERAQKLERKNAKRVARGKEPKRMKEKECPRTIRVWLREDVGEAPVILDSSLVSRSSEQLELYLGRKGYFNAQVSDTVYHNRSKPFSSKRGRAYRQPKVEVEYQVKAGPAYSLCSLDREVNDPAIDSLVAASWSSSLLKPGARFDAETLEKERIRITGMLRQQGYLYFTKDLLHYSADTAVGTHEVDLVLHFERPLAKGRRGLVGTPEATVFHLGNVAVDMSPHSRSGQPRMPTDTMLYKEVIYLYTGDRPAFRPKTLSSNILMQPGDRFSEAAYDRTYRRLANLRVFDRVDISFDTTGTGAPDVADVRIMVLPSQRQSLSLEGYGTNRGGFLGTSISLNYGHKNLFRSIGSINAQMSLGLEAQQSLDARGGASDAGTRVGREVLFNTMEFGPEVTIRFPRFLIPLPYIRPNERWKKTWGTHTAVNLMYNYQRRPDYTRTLAQLSFGYEWRKRGNRIWAFYPAEINVIRIPHISGAFHQFIQESRDAVLRDGYTDHVIAGARASMTLRSPSTQHNRNVFFWRPSIQTSGNLLRVANLLLGTEQHADTAGNQYYTAVGVRFAQFVKIENDLRFYHRIHEKSNLAFRFDAGVGIPFGNLEVLPFESSFFSGGANGLRAWRARSLGPGSYSAPLDAYDRVGEVRLEFNAEYRFKLIGYLEGAFFMDAGNIWDMKENPAKPGSGFKLAEIPGEIAIGTGVGARLNFDFFLVRFDLGLQTKDPTLPPGQRWLFEAKPPGLATSFANKLNLNLGIGYPF